MTALRLDLEWRTTLLTAVLLPVLIALGFWQLQRAEEKTRIAEQYAQRELAAAIPLGTLTTQDPGSLVYRKVTISGHYIPDASILLDNQIRDGRYGMDAAALFLDESSNQLVLLNRGWLAADPARRALPSVEIPGAQQTLRATVYVPPGEPYLLAEENFAGLEWPLLVQSLDSVALHDAIEAEFDLPLFAAQLRLAPDEPGGFRRDWPVVNVSPQKHQGYALQWFTMAAVLLLFFVFRSSNLAALLRRRKAESPLSNRNT